MKKYIIKRTLALVPTFLGALIIIFVIYSYTPGQFSDTLYEVPNMTQEKIDKINKKYGLDKPKYIQFGIWLKGAIKGDFGEIYMARVNAKPMKIGPMITESAKHTIKIMTLSMTISILIAVKLSSTAAYNKNSLKSKLIKVLSMIGISLPNFALAMLLLVITRYNKFVINYSIKKGALSIRYYQFILTYYILPFLVITFIYISNFVKHITSGMETVLNEAYITTAKAYGHKDRKILYKYALKNTIIPIIAFIGTSFPIMFSDMIIIESTLEGGGLGSLLYGAIRGRQYNIIMGCTLFFVIITLIGNYFVDLICIFMDPRLKQSIEKANIS